MAKQRIEPDAVLEWLKEHHPELAKTAEMDRNWVWLCCGEMLKGPEPEKEAVRDSIGKFGFRFARNGHPMPSGNTGIWAHSCLVFKRFAGGKSKSNNGAPRSKGNAQPKPTSNGKGRIDPFEVSAERDEPQLDPDLAAGMAFFG